MIGSLNKKNRFPVYGEIFFMTFHKDVVFKVCAQNTQREYLWGRRVEIRCSVS